MPNDYLAIILLVLGFGFVIFFHELGHFLAAKSVGIKVEQFAVGFGQALIAWRKGIGFHIGTTTPEYEKRIDQYLKGRGGKADDEEPTPLAIAEAEKTLGLGETEYRLNWIPLGGYVKMLGQDDLRPNSAAEDPRAYNRKSIPARMLVVSAGVLMNILLAAIGFTIVFRMGFHVPPAVVGGVAPDSPAQRAGLQVGDQIINLDGKRQWDFTKVGLNVALCEPGVSVPIDVMRGGKLLHLKVTPEAPVSEQRDLVSLGIEIPRELSGLTDTTVIDDPKLYELLPHDALTVGPGETITHINGRAVSPDDYQFFDSIVQSSFGRPIELTVEGVNHKTRRETIHAQFAEPFSGGPIQFAGMTPRARIDTIVADSPARGKLLPGDVVESAGYANNHDTLQVPPSRDQLTNFLHEAGADHQNVWMKVLRVVDGVEQEKAVSDLQTMRLKGSDNKRGVGVTLGLDAEHPIVSDVLKDSPAAAAGISRNATINAVNGQAVHSWFDVQHALLSAVADVPLPITFTDAGGESHTAKLLFNADQIAAIHTVSYDAALMLSEPKNVPRKASSTAQALWWGITETRDSILQFYLTIRRMFERSIPLSGASGPIGIFIAGRMFASKGTDWLIWFLSMISANLAVVNFLPIPIVDGGLFTFLILEAIQGKPLSPRTQAIAQYAGLAFLVCVFLFVSYHDIIIHF